MLRVPGRYGRMVVAALFLPACSDGGSGPRTPTAMQINGTIPGTAPVGSVLTPSVRLTDGGGRAVAGVAVTFDITAGGGSVANATAHTDADGIASAGSWTLGTAAGANTLIARHGSLAPVSLVVNGTATAPAAMAAAATNRVSATAGISAIPAPGARITDEHGNPVAGVQVTFTPGAGSGSVSGATQATDATGTARPGSWTLGQTAGTQTLTASAGTLGTVITIEAVPGPASVLVPLTALTQTAPIDGPVGELPSIRAQDRFGNIVPGATVTFAVTSGGGAAAGVTRTTDAAGIATVGSWTLGPMPGPNTLTATIVGAGSLSFSATGLDASGLVAEKLTGDGTTCPINIAGCVFTVRVTQAGGQPVAGETIIWSNGTGTTVNAVTNTRGIATAGNIGPNDAVGSRTQVATIQTTGQQLTFAYELVAGAGYDIEVRFVGNAPGAAVQAAFTEARLRWESVITGELTNVQSTVQANACGITHPAISEVVDDLLVLVVVEPIDGAGQVLGSAGPCLIRNSSGLTILGAMRLDSADLATLAGNGRLRDVVLHELGHTLGFPLLWDDDFHGLLEDTATANPYYSGARGAADFVSAGGTLVNDEGVPVENTGGGGTRLSHWRESVLSSELMTGFIGGTNNPLSAITIGSLMDIGYQVNFGVADAYILPGAGLREGSGAAPFELRELPLPRPRIAH